MSLCLARAACLMNRLRLPWQFEASLKMCIRYTFSSISNFEFVSLCSLVQNSTSVRASNQSMASLTERIATSGAHAFHLICRNPPNKRDRSNPEFQTTPVPLPLTACLFAFAQATFSTCRGVASPRRTRPRLPPPCATRSTRGLVWLHSSSS